MTGASHNIAQRRSRSAWQFLLPALIVIIVVAAWPLIRTIWFGFTNASLSDLESYSWIGFENFKFLLSDPDWWLSVKNTLIFAITSVTLETLFGVFLALLLHSEFKGRTFLRTAVLVPWAIPTIVSARMWSWMFHDVYGVINDLLLKTGLSTKVLAWTANPDLAMITVVLVDVWKTTPFMALLILAGLQMLPQECYEAARVDGVHPVRVFFKVTLPLLKPTILVAVIFRMLDALRVFDLIYILTSGSQDTMSMSVYARQQLFDFQDVGTGSAAATLLFIIVAICVIIYMSLGGLTKDTHNA